MSGFRIRARWFTAVSACLLLVACGDGAPEKGSDKPAATGAKASGPKPAVAGAQMVAAVSSGKSATAVGVHFSLGTSPRVGTALPVDIAVIPHEAFTSLEAHFDTQGGLTLISGEDLESRTDVKPESTIPHQLVLMPDKEGVFVVTVSLHTEGKEGTVTRIFSIPVIVAPAGEPAAPNPPPAAAPDPAGG